jgi:hypothetical protein
MKTPLRAHVEHDVRRLGQGVRAFARQLLAFMQIEVLNQQGQFTFFRRYAELRRLACCRQAAVHTVSRLSGGLQDKEHLLRQLFGSGVSASNTCTPAIIRGSSFMNASSAD